MSCSDSVRPRCFLYPIQGLRSDQGVAAGVEVDDEYVDKNLALTGEPIVGTDKVAYDEETGPGALEARPLPSPKGMSARQREIHDMTHLPYDPSCEVYTSSRRPNTQHRSVPASVRALPLMLDDQIWPCQGNAEEVSRNLSAFRIYIHVCHNLQPGRPEA